MHPLTKLLFEEGHFSGHRKPIEAEKVITTYLRERADWLMNSCLHKNGRSSVELIEQAFELSEKCEEIKLKCKGCEYEEDVVSNVGHPCWDCKPYGSANGFKLKTPRSSLPSKIDKPIAGVDKWEHLFERQRETINKILDFLHSKEAREG